MNCIPSLLLAVAFSGSASAQFLDEDFSSGVPPVGWMHINNNSSATAGWLDDGTTRAWHQDESSNLGTADNVLLSPLLDFTTANTVALSFDGETNWPVYLSNHPNSFGDGVSTMEITTDGGLTWTVVWTDSSLNNGDTYSPTVDLSIWGGIANVQLGIHYYGTFAQEWWVDDLMITGNQSLVYSISGLMAGGTVALSVVGTTAGGDVLIAYSMTGPGPTATPFGMVDMSLPIFRLRMLTANSAGVATTAAYVPIQALGKTIYSQAVDVFSNTLTNSVSAVIP